MTPAERDKFADVINHGTVKDYPATVVTKVMRSRGYQVNADAVRRHRNRDCHNCLHRPLPLDD